MLTGRGKMQQFAVDKYKVGDKVLRLYREKVPATKISDVLRMEDDIKIAPLAINRWLKFVRSQDKTEIVAKNTEKFEAMIVDYKEEITTILDEVKEMKEYAKEQKQLDSYVKLVSKLFQGLELLAKLMGDIKPSGSVDINVIINKINEQVVHEKRNLRETLHSTNTIIDVEAEIIEQDKQMEEDLNG